MDMKMDSRGYPITVEDLIFELSEIHACQIMLSWDETVGKTEAGAAIDKMIAVDKGDDPSNDDDLRRHLVRAMVEVGYSRIPGIKPRVIKMIEEIGSCVHHARTGLPFLSSSEINDEPGDWLLSSDAANTIRKELLTDRQREIIELKATEGRYTIEEAADFIVELVWRGSSKDVDESSGESDELDDSCDIEFSEILSELSDAAFRGKLQMYWPGTDKRFGYGQNVNTDVRVFFEEVYWTELNRWLEINKKEITIRFPDPNEKVSGTKYRGVTKGEILASDWGLSAGKLKKILDDVPNWVSEARVSRGRPGGGAMASALWSPVVLAECLLGTAPRKPWSVPIGTLDAIFGDAFKGFLEEWNEYKETFARGLG